MFFICVCIYVEEFFEFFKKDDFWLCKNAIENWVYLIVTHILKFWFFLGCNTSRVAYWISKNHGGGICSIGLTILELRPKNFNCFVIKRLSFGYFFNIVSRIQLNPCPWVLQFLYSTLEKELAQLDILYWRNIKKIAFFISKILQFLAIAQKW